MVKVLPTDRATTTRLLTVVATLYLLFVLYGCWVPLHFRYRSLSDAWQTFAALPFLDQSIESATDWATNFLLLIPLSFLWAQRFEPERGGYAALTNRLIILALSIALAFSLEFSQLYFPARTVSQKDILALSLGAFVGVLAQYRWGSMFENWLSMLWQKESHQARVIRLLHVYLLALFVFSVLPLDLTLSLVEIYHKWREGRVFLLPFTGLKGSAFENTYETITDILIWVPVGLFWALERKSSLLKIAAIGWLTAGIIELAQLFVYSRVTDITDIMLGGVGSALGGLLAIQVRQTQFGLKDVPARFWYFLWSLWALMVFAVFWFPFDFRSTGVSVNEAWQAITRLPFLTLYQQSEFRAINEILRKIGFFLPGGILLGLGVAARSTEMSRGATRHAGQPAFFLLVLTAVAIEAGQLFLPGKFADLTDVILEAGGGLLGLIIVRWVLGSQHDALNPQRPPANHDVTSTTATGKTMYGNHTQGTRLRLHLLTFGLLTLGVFVVTRLPFVPYNVRELNSPGIAGLFSTFGLSVLIYWVANGHFLFLHWAGRTRLLALPVWLIIHALLAWIIIRISIPMESIYDIVGSPVLDWPWEWELIGRYLALHVAIALQLVGAILVIQLLTGRGTIAGLIAWVMFSVLLAWPLHKIVVEWAATDNLTELMSGGGNLTSSTLLAIGFFSFFLTSGANAAIVAFGNRRGGVILTAVVIAVSSTIVATAAFWFGTEQMIVKYGKIFSAWQFLLSTDRQNYAYGASLVARYVLVYAALVIPLGLLQAWSLRSMANER
jgi:glycopeptide antibiotics resistance protein